MHFYQPGRVATCCLLGVVAGLIVANLFFQPGFNAGCPSLPAAGKRLCAPNGVDLAWDIQA